MSNVHQASNDAVAPLTSTTETLAVVPTRPSAGQFWKRLLLFCLVCGAGGGTVWAVTKFTHAPQQLMSQEKKLAADVMTVKLLSPKLAQDSFINVDTIAFVEPYYRADLRARASGLINRVNYDIGDQVKAGDVLLEIDVPESIQEVAKAEAAILQRRQELRVSKAKLKDALAMRQVSKATVKQRQADVSGATATRDFCSRKLKRLRELALTGSVVGNVVEEQERDLLTSESTLESAKANVEKALADLQESESKVEAAEADIDLKEAQIVVATKELERAKVVSEYGKIIAPFDGVIVRRNVDPGSFVQNATTGFSEPLISLSRVDIVTISSRFSDAVAPFVNRDTVATVEIEDLPGISISAKISRFAPSVQNADHTMRVELDLYNSDPKQYQQFIESLKVPQQKAKILKGKEDNLPINAFANSMTMTQRLIPGMKGTMKLRLGSYESTYILPSSAIYTKSGTPYILCVLNGVTKQIPVKIQVSDGKTTRLAMIVEEIDSSGSSQTRLRSLNGRELIVGAKQIEIGDGVQVKGEPIKW